MTLLVNLSRSKNDLTEKLIRMRNHSLHHENSSKSIMID